MTSFGAPSSSNGASAVARRTTATASFPIMTHVPLSVAIMAGPQQQPVVTSIPSLSSPSTMLPLLLVLRGGGPSSSRLSSTAAAAAAKKKGKGKDTTKALNNKKSASSACEGNALSRWWYGTIPQPLRFFVSGNLGNVCFYACERFMYRVVFHSEHVISLLPDASLLEDYKDSVSFLLGYLLHIVMQHYLHALLVYGLSSIDTPRKYWTTLFGLYQALCFAAFGSTFLNAALLPYMHRTAAFVTTLWVFACINYVWIGWIVAQSESKATMTTSSSKNPTNKNKNKRTTVAQNKAAKSWNKASSSSSLRSRSVRGGALLSSSVISSPTALTTASLPQEQMLCLMENHINDKEGDNEKLNE